MSRPGKINTFVCAEEGNNFADYIGAGPFPEMNTYTLKTEMHVHVQCIYPVTIINLAFIHVWHVTTMVQGLSIATGFSPT